jgi:hypothetical protein
MKTKTMKTKTMKTKTILSLTCALVLLCLGGQANAAVVVTNGNFSDLTGLTYEGGPWYSGVPTGWSGINTGYTVIYTGNPSPGVFTYAANLQALSRPDPFVTLNQNVGTTDVTGDVTLKFNLTPITAGSTFDVAAAIFNATTGGLLATAGQLQAGTNIELTALNVSSGTLLNIAFWYSYAPTAPGLTNVSISQIPEPSTGSMMALGFAGLVTTRLLRRKDS